MRRPILFVSTALVALLAMAGAAQAATPFTAGSGTRPDVAVGADGVGHVAWMQSGTSATVAYCRVPAGGTSCDRGHVLDFGVASAQSAGRALVFAPAANKVVVVATCWNCPGGVNRTFLWTSNNNGESFTAQGQIGETTTMQSLGAGEWLDDAGMFVSASGAKIKATLRLGPGHYPEGDGLPFITSGLFSYGTQVVRQPATNLLVAASNDLGTVKYAVYTGGVLDHTAINKDVAPINWERDLAFPDPETGSKETALASGPNGVYISYLSGPVGSPQISLRRLDPGTLRFGPPVHVQGTDGIEKGTIDLPDSYQDAAGRLHLVWRSLYNEGRLRYRVSDTSGSNFGPVGTLAKKEQFFDPEVAAGPAGTGFAVWNSTGNTVRVVALEPEAESASGGPGGPGGPGGDSPRVTGARIGDSTLRPGEGTTFTFTSSTAGRAVLTIEKQFPGLKVKRRVKNKAGKRVTRQVCLPRTRGRLRALQRQAGSPQAYRRLLRRKSCRFFRKIGEIRRQVRPGRNTIRFNGRVAGRPLGPGVYRAKLVVTDSAGQRSRVELLRFRVVAKKKRR